MITIIVIMVLLGWFDSFLFKEGSSVKHLNIFTIYAGHIIINILIVYTGGKYWIHHNKSIFRLWLIVNIAALGLITGINILNFFFNSPILYTAKIKVSTLRILITGPFLFLLFLIIKGINSRR